VNYRRDNEQLAFVVEGELEVDLNDEQLDVGTRCIVHIPPGATHEFVAPHGALIILAQDKNVEAPSAADAA
jgi:mannose-6-phosphate isomerase-like protein (cupin superfamily)